MRDGFRIFDTHTHIGDARHNGRSYSPDALLRAMDSYGIDRSVAIPFPVVEDFRRQHDIIGDAVGRYPGPVDWCCLSLSLSAVGRVQTGATPLQRSVWLSGSEIAAAISRA